MASSRDTSERPIGAVSVDVRSAVKIWTQRFARNNLLTYASAMAFQLFVAVASLVFLAVALLRPLGAEETWQTTVVPALSSRLPPEWMSAVTWSVDRELQSSAAPLVALGAVVAVWEVSGSVRAIMGALNRIYGVDETRGTSRRFALSILLATAVSIFLIAAAFVGGGALEPSVPVLGPAERIVLPAIMVYAVVALLVLVAPARRQPWRWVSAGSLGIVIAWMLVSAAFAYWIGNVVDLRSPEGVLALVLSTAGYLYAGAIVFLIGAQLDELLREGGAAAALGVRPR
ncbi:MAG TPA: YihY/virulence factor BrkB family protein [Gaiellales bacterium]|nr:YihY/virulence factor BrkB family protein [Gaiellales bacterium]